MHRPQRLSAVTTLALLVLGLAGARSALWGQTPPPDTGGRTMTVADIIRMTTFGSQPRGYRPEDLDVPSPNGRLHAVVVKRGDVEQNTNVYSLLLFNSEALSSGAKPDTVLTLASSSNRPAIGHVRWLADNRTLVFLGERPGELPQVYTLDLGTRQLTPRTRYATEITSYDIAPSGNALVYAAKPAADTSAYPAMRQRGFVLRPAQFVGDVLTGAWAGAASEWESKPQVLVWRSGSTAPVKVTVPGSTYHSCDLNSVSVAPSGHFALIECQRERAPAGWKGYTEPWLARLVAAGTTFAEFALLDLDRGTVAPLVDAPIYGATSRWAPDGASIVIANAFLPLDTTDSTEQHVRANRPGIAEVDVRTSRVTVIAHRDSLDPVAWDSTSNTVDFVAGMNGTGALDGPHVGYRKTPHGWVEVRGARAAPTPTVLVVDQGLNQRPRLVAVDRRTKQRTVVLDPNPQLATLHLGREEIVQWRTKGGAVRVGGLYRPPDFVPGRRYPLVIQTHGFDSTAFAPDGTYPTANAAQPMAAHGMLVLQVGRDHAMVNDILTPREAPNAMEEIEGAIDHLDSLGLIDRSRVGVIGFSRTCFHVLYTLTHSKYPIAAAAITDGVDFGYLQYMLFQNARLASGETLDEYGGVNGGPPFGKTLDTWRERAPGFNLDHVTTPLRLEAIGVGAVLAEWEPYAGLLLQHKPAEMAVLPDGVHLLIKPWERIASSQTNADWFRFWLKGEEDPDPAKGEQYARWHELRKLQREQAAGDTAGSKR